MARSDIKSSIFDKFFDHSSIPILPTSINQPSDTSPLVTQLDNPTITNPWDHTALGTFYISSEIY